MKEVLSSYFRRKFKSAPNEEARQIHEMARDYYGGDFPNPRRKDCPPQESFRRLMNEDDLPDDDLRNHLFGCSECFNEYRALLRQAKSAEVSKKTAFSFQYKMLRAGSLAAALIVLGSLFWFWKTDSNSLQTAQNGKPEAVQNSNTDVETSRGAVAENAETNLEDAKENQPKVVAENNSNNSSQNKQANRVVPEKQFPAKQIEPKLLAKNEVEINLNEPVWRDSPREANQKIVRLEAKETHLRVKLPEENPAGVYQIFLVDEFGKTLTEKKAVRAKNQTLFVRFDLSKIGGNQKRLCFAPAGEIPDCVLVSVEPPK